MKIVTKKFIAGTALALLVGCNPKAETKPLLTKEVFFAAAERCGAQQPEFIQHSDGRAPSVRYLESDLPGAQASPTSQCLANALTGHRFVSLEIRLAPRDGAVR